MELFGSRLLTVRLSCGRQNLAVLPLNCTFLVHFLSSVCCVPFSFSATCWTTPEPSLKIWSMLLLAYSWNREQNYSEDTSTAMIQVVRWGFIFAGEPANWLQKSSMFSTTFQMAEKCSKNLGSWSFCCCRCNKIITSLICMHCVFDFQFLSEFLRD